MSNCSQAQHKKLKKAGDLVTKKDVYVNGYDQKIEAESGWIAVPENRSKSTESIIKIPFFRFKSYSSTPESPVIYLSGGPGNSGIQEGKSQLFWLLKSLRAHSDVILFDQRGTGESLPSLSLDKNFNLPLNETLDSEASDQALRQATTQMAEFLQVNKIDPAAYNTLENAADVNDLIKGLGYEKVSILSDSYGSHLALAVMKYHPELVDRTVLVGANGLDQRWRSPMNIASQIKVVQDFIDADPKLLKIYPQFEETVYQVLEGLEKKPVSVSIEIDGKPEEVLIGRYDLEVIHALSMAATRNVGYIALTYKNASEGNFEGIAEALVETLKRRNIGTIMTYLTSSASGVSRARQQEITSDMKATGHTDAMNYPFNRIDFQTALGSTPLSAEFREDFSSKIPTMLLSGEFDVRTSVKDARSLKKKLTNSRHYIVPLTSHDVLFFPPESVAAISGFLNEGSFPEALDRGGKFVIRTPDTPDNIKKVLGLMEAQGLQVGLDVIKKSHAGSEIIVNPFLVNGVGTSILRADRYEEAYKVFELGMELFPEVWYFHGNAAISLSRIGSKGIKLGKDKSNRTATAFKHYEHAKKLNPYYFSAELEKLKN